MELRLKKREDPNKYTLCDLRGDVEAKKKWNLPQAHEECHRINAQQKAKW